MRKFIIGLSLLITNSYAIISIAQDEPSGEIKKSLQVAFSYGELYGNTESQTFHGDSKITFYGIDDVKFIKFYFSYGETSGVKSVDNKELSMSYLKKQSSRVSIEYFAKVKQDEFIDLKADYIIGLGTRLKFDTKNNTNKIYIGMGAYHSWLEESDIKKELSRLNSYFAYSKYINKLITFHYNTYFKPKLNDFDDFLIEQNAQLILNITKSLKFSMKLKHNYDSMPVGDIKKYDISQYNGIRYKF